MIFLFWISITTLFSQAHSSWLNYSFSQRVTDICLDNINVWVATQGGLVKYNKSNGQKTYYNRANSNLPDNNLLSLCIDKDKSIWVGGKYYGIGKYNGEKCTIYNQSNSGLPFDQYNAKIKIDKNGDIWVASFRWIAKFDGTNWKSWKTGNNLSTFPIISDFVIDENEIVWICSTDGLGKIENDIYSIVPGIPGSMTSLCMAIDNQRNIWIGRAGTGLYQYDGTRITNYNTSNSCLPTNQIFDIAFDSQNKMWLATPEGLIKFGISQCYLYRPPVPDTSLLRVMCDVNDTVWCGSFSGKLMCFNGTNFNSIELSNSPLKDNYIMDIIADNENNTWIATKKNVVKKSNDQFSAIFNKQSNAFALNKEGAVWIAFDSGDTCLLKYKPDLSIVFDSLNSPLNTNKVKISNMIVDNNILWIATSRYGLFKYDGVTFTNYNISNSTIPSNEVGPLLFDQGNNLWGGSANGIFKFDGSTWTVWNRSNSNIPTNMVNGIAVDKDNKIWFSCMDESRIVGIEYGGGLTCFDGLNIMKTYNIQNSGLLCNTIMDIHIDKNNLLWLSTYGAGLMSFDMINIWKVYDVNNSGIANNVVQKINQDKSGYLWLGHIDAGISVFNPGLDTFDINEKEDEKKTFIINPNPFKYNTNITFKITENNSIVTLKVYDIKGILLEIPIKGQSYNSGTQNVNWISNNFKSGIYFFSLTINGKTFNRKFLID